MVERRQALLHDQLHKVDVQPRVEELDVPFTCRLAEATFAGNCLLTVNGSTPYMALYGRTPNMLPSLSLSAAAADDSTGTLVGLARHVHRVRELALQ
eukprot:11194255-Lingulodinium_polyedra.AAC.1